MRGFGGVSGATAGSIIMHICTKGQLNSELIYDAIISPKMPTKNLKDFCPGSLLEGRTEILQINGIISEVQL